MRRSYLGGLLVGVPVVAILACAAPASAAVSHVVVSGESLSSVAYANGISISSLASYNGLGEEDLLIIGQTIQVPSATEVGATTTTSAASSSGHVVVSGDSLSSIAYANGISISEPGELQRARRGRPADHRADDPGPGASGTSTTSSTSSGSGHVVVSGESLSSIAYANGISISELASYNGLGEDDLLIIGQTIQVPAASSSTATSSSGVPLGSIDSPYGTLYLESNAAELLELDAPGVDRHLRGRHLPGRAAERLPHLRPAGRALPAVPRRGRRRRRRRRGPRSTTSARRSTWRPTRCARSSTRSAAPTAGASSRRRTSGGT